MTGGNAAKSSGRGALSFLPRGGPAVVMGATTLAAIGAVIYSHDSQVRDRESMKAGVQRDKERIRQKRKEKQQLERQRQEQQQQQ
mmetsp:Transcript_11419/g.24218  ORF Transcript_11419/g.24218 Transcript_11419/m.24218 type:complete len:85 (-) Transcript_11419:521-775(-)